MPSGGERRTAAALLEAEQILVVIRPLHVLLVVPLVEAAVGQPAGNGKARKGRVPEADELSSVFGVDIDTDGISPRDRIAKTAGRELGDRKRRQHETAVMRRF